MRLAIRLPYHASDISGPGLASVARAADEAGFHSGWVADHIVFPAEEIRSVATTTADGKYPRPLDEPTLESWTTLAYAAAVTTRLKLAVGVTVLPYRSPLVLAKTVMTLDVLSGGRVMCGAGIGWLEEEFVALGAPYATRRKLTEDTIGIMRAAWASSPVTYEGQVFSIPEPVHFNPRPAGPIPIIMGGHSEPALKRAALIGDGWIGHEYMPAQAGETRRHLAELAGGELKPDFDYIISRLMNPAGAGEADPTRLDTDAAGLEAVFEDYDAAGVDVLLCEPTIRTVDAHLKLIDQVHAAGSRWLAAGE